jgi:hypothetical protein
MDKSDFRVVIKRLPGYVPLVALRFEMLEGYGELIVGDDRMAAPAAAGEVPEVTGDQLRAGRFVHVLSSGKRRQSYSLSRLDDDRIQRLDDSRWTELVTTTEFGLRYLDLADVERTVGLATVTVSANPAPARSAAPGLTAGGASVATSTSVRPAPSRILAQAPRAGTPGVAAAASGTGGPPPARSVVAQPAEPRSLPAFDAAVPSVGPSLAEDTIRRLGVDALRANLLHELAVNRELQLRLQDLENALESSRARERDLLEILSRWQGRG